MKFLYAIQDGTGREVCSEVVEPDKVSDVAATYDPKTGIARLFHAGEEIASGTTEGAASQLHFLRWKAKDKLGAGVKHRVAVVE